jgi:hypothetical protein
VIAVGRPYPQRGRGVGLSALAAATAPVDLNRRQVAAECLLGRAWADVAAGVADPAMIELDGTADKLVSAPTPSSAR